MRSHRAFNFQALLIGKLLTLLPGSPNGSEDSCDIVLFGARIPLLKKYIDNNSSLELQALFALQTLAVQLDHPPGEDLKYLVLMQAAFGWDVDSKMTREYVQFGL